MRVVYHRGDSETVVNRTADEERQSVSCLLFGCAATRSAPTRRSVFVSHPRVDFCNHGNHG